MVRTTKDGGYEDHWSRISISQLSNSGCSRRQAQVLEKECKHRMGRCIPRACPPKRWCNNDCSIRNHTTKFWRWNKPSSSSRATEDLWRSDLHDDLLHVGSGQKCPPENGLLESVTVYCVRCIIHRAHPRFVWYDLFLVFRIILRFLSY